MKKSVLLLFCLMSAASLLGSIQSDSLLAEGKLLFRNNCKACHNLDKNLVGPALSKVYQRRDSSWIYKFVKVSQKMIDDGDVIATELYNQFNQVMMPDQNLNNEQITLILSYIENEDNSKITGNINPISRPIVPKKYYSNHFRFSNFIFWIPFTISVILGVFILYFMTHYYEIIENHTDNNHQD